MTDRLPGPDERLPTAWYYSGSYIASLYGLLLIEILTEAAGVAYLFSAKVIRRLKTRTAKLVKHKPVPEKPE